MYLFNDKWEVNILGVNYNPNSVDNTVRPDAYIKICDEFSKTILLNITDIAHGYYYEREMALKDAEEKASGGYHKDTRRYESRSLYEDT